MKYALFLGCTVPARARNYELSTRKVAEKMGIEFVDVKEFACCGFPVKSIDQETSLLIAARNLSLAEEAGLGICTVCSACTSVLTEASKRLEEDEELREEVNKKLGEIGRSYKGEVKVRHFARVLYEEVGIESIKGAVVKELSRFQFAPHYGCHYLKPSEIYDGFDEPEFPRSLDNLIEATGAGCVDYEDKNRCCGGGILGVDENLSLKMAKVKLDQIKKVGADGIALVCPFCSVMYDDNQRKIESSFDESYNLPVLYYPQILGLALGFEGRELGMNMNRVKTKELLAKVA